MPPRVTHVKVEDKDVYLVGTAHISKESVEDVRTTVEQVRPDAICVELCKARHQAMTQADNWRKMDIFKIIRQKKAVFLLAQLILSSFYRRLGEKLGVQPGAEMLEGIHLAEQTGATLVLADRDIDVTLKRVWGYLGFWSKLKLAMQILMSILFTEKIDVDMIEQLKKQDQLEAIMAEFAQRFPEIKRRLIDERDTYLAQKIRTAPGKTRRRRRRRRPRRRHPEPDSPGPESRRVDDAAAQVDLAEDLRVGHPPADRGPARLGLHQRHHPRL